MNQHTQRLELITLTRIGPWLLAAGIDLLDKSRTNREILTQLGLPQTKHNHRTLDDARSYMFTVWSPMLPHTKFQIIAGVDRKDGLDEIFDTDFEDRR